MITHLPFDSDLFGFKVARIDLPRLETEVLRSALNALKNEDVRLVYWASDAEDDASQSAAKECKGTFVDKKVFYVKEVDSNDKNALSSRGVITESIKPITTVTDSLRHMAHAIGMQSRFVKDPHWPEGSYIKMYDVWIENCVKRDVADEVLGIYNDDDLMGFAALKETNGAGEIYLIAVGEAYRGKGVGKKLINSSEAYFHKRGLHTLNIVTQATNLPACKLYESMGYKHISTEHFYHFWL